jgi:predicted TIM-barrel fold metal-dependent hydrolase
MALTLKEEKKMTTSSPLKIDIFSHILPIKYRQALDKMAPGHTQQRANSFIPTLSDLDHRFRIMEKYGVMHLLTLSRPPIEEVVNDPQKALDLTRMANDEMAELVQKYPDRFPAAAASLSLTDIDGSLAELERAIVDLRFRGVQLYTHMNTKPLDSPEFMPLFEMMSKYNLPILLHPTTGVTGTDYESEKGSKYMVDTAFGWPYETTLAMTRLVFSGILEKWPNLKVITHHGAGMAPYYEERIKAFHDTREMTYGGKDKVGLTKAPIEYYKMFYADTALYGNTPGLMMARAFCGIDHLLFATDFPFAGLWGERVTRQTITAIEAMDITDEERKKIYEDNARKVFRLPI